MDKFFNFIKPYLDFIDSGKLYREPFSWIYIVISVLNLVLPLYMLISSVINGVFAAGFNFAIAFLLVWIVIAFTGWLGFQLWWNRSKRVIAISEEGADFVATPVFAHFIQTFGEWAGTCLAIVGFFATVIFNIFFGKDAFWFASMIGLGAFQGGWINLVFLPILGFFIIIFSRFIAESARALAAIANNTRK
ncbi:hypothetical protein WKV44_08680 [Spirochaetia bacterium 38H-sp]|uniref:Yip1 domain-containing protein n=1 Tax=Rarispira pelagica TaxID=3141764 RepID=A0ABU9UDU6_9SPIR